MKTMKQTYITPVVQTRRVFLEAGIAAKASVLISSAANIQQQNWNDIADETVGDATSDPQGDIWFIY
jgi:hypothetical protein